MGLVELCQLGHPGADELQVCAAPVICPADAVAAAAFIEKLAVVYGGHY